MLVLEVDERVEGMAAIKAELVATRIVLQQATEQATASRIVLEQLRDATIRGRSV